MATDIIIQSQAQLEQLIKKWGFLPFFRNGVEGFSIEEMTPPDRLFADDAEGGAWQWKGPIISHWEAAYGKFFNKKAGFISLAWLPDFMNWRRSLYPLKKQEADARHILEVLRENESMLSKQLKVASGFSLSRKRNMFNPEDPTTPIVNRHNGTSFDAHIAQLQMGAYVCIADFEYLLSKQGEPYGWGVARYCTPEAMYEFDYRKAVEGRTPQESRQRIVQHIQTLFPEAPTKQIDKIVG